MYANSTAGNKKMIFSSSTGVPSFWQSNVGRIIDYFNEDDSYQTVLHSILGLSTMGATNLGYKWTFTNSSNPVGFLNLILPVGVAEVEEFTEAPIFNFKYMLIKYIKTQLYMQVMNGFPMLRPVFFDYPEFDEYYNDAFSTFLYGPSFFVNFLQQEKTPYGFWC